MRGARSGHDAWRRVVGSWSARRSTALAAAVAAVCLLTTFTSADRPAELAAGARVAHGADPSLDVETPRTESEPPQLGRMLAANDPDGSYPVPQIPMPDIGGERSLTPFRSPSAPGVSERDVVPADLIVRAVDGTDLDLDTLAEPLAAAHHVGAAASVTVEGSASGTADDPQDLDVLGVDGPTFRPLTPEVTATSDAVWERLAEGDALVSHEAAERLGLELGGTLVLRTDTATVPVRIGAFAANGTPPLADVIVPLDVAALLGRSAPNLLVVTATGDVETLGDALGAATGGTVEILRPTPPAAPTSSPTRSATSGAVEGFSYSSHRDGRITIYGNWVAQHIVPVELPGMARTRCHRLMVPQLYAAVEELIARDLYSHLDPSQFAGCFVARHIDWDPSKRLSKHAWGLAIDFNVRDNALGATPKMDPRVVEVFERWGFDWGGHWRRPDGMHFELARIVPVP